jgi:ATP-dependent protease HslVU (ClpYQ) peptidase subunit
MSPLMAKLKCPHGRGKDNHELEAVTEVSGDGLVEAGKMTLKEAAEKIELSYRQKKILVTGASSKNKEASGLLKEEDRQKVLMDRLRKRRSGDMMK